MSTNHHTPFNVGDLLSAQALNSRLSALDSAIASTGSFTGLRAYSDISNDIDSGTTSAYIEFDTEVIDTHGFFDVASSRTTVTIPAGQGGYYLLTYLLNLRAASTPSDVAKLTVEISGQSATQRRYNAALFANGQSSVVALPQLALLSVADTLQLKLEKPSADILSAIQAEVLLLRVG
jgi:hypothetical protein